MAGVPDVQMSILYSGLTITLYRWLRIVEPAPYRTSEKAAQQCCLCSVEQTIHLCACFYSWDKLVICIVLPESQHCWTAPVLVQHLWSTSTDMFQWVLFWSCCRLLRSASRLHTWFPALHSYLQWYFWSFSPVILSSQATPMMSPTLRLWWKTMSSPPG